MRNGTPSAILTSMLSNKDVLELLDFQAPEASVVSLYLDGGAPDPARELKTLVKEAQTKEPRLQDLEKDVARLAAFAAEAPKAAGLAAFSCAARGFWRACPLPETVKSVLRVGRAPFLAPLVNLLDQRRRFGVALIDGKSARFMEVHLGQVCEPPEPPAFETPARAGGETEHARLKDFADRLMALVRARGLERVILGAPPELETTLLSHLHTQIQDNLIVDARLNPSLSPQEVLARVTDGETQSRIVRESVLVYRLLDAVRDGGTGVVGLQETLNALQRGQVRMLLVREGLAKLGRACSRCGSLGLAGKKCLACGGPTEPVFNLVSEIAQAALERGCEVVRLFHDRRLDALGGIGAELRFRVGRRAPRAITAI